MRNSVHPTIRRATAVVAVVALLLDTACFTYGSAPVTGLVPGSDVRLTLTDAGSAELAGTLGPRIHTVIGQIGETFGDTASSVVVEDLQTVDGTSIPWAGRGRVTLPTRDVAAVHVRTLNRRLTWVTASVVGAVFTFVIVSAVQRARSDGTSKTPPGSPPPELRSPP